MGVCHFATWIWNFHLKSNKSITCYFWRHFKTIKWRSIFIVYVHQNFPNLYLFWYHDKKQIHKVLSLYKHTSHDMIWLWCEYDRHCMPTGNYTNYYNAFVLYITWCFIRPFSRWKLAIWQKLKFENGSKLHV